MRLATYYGQNAAQTTEFGSFTAAYRGGYEAGPLALFPPSLEHVLVMSPLDSFMVTQHNINGSDAGAGTELRFGLQGLLHTLPIGFSVDFVLSVSVPTATVVHSGVIAAAFMGWGDVLLRAHGGVRTPPDASVWISKLGYSTTGVFHYNPCDCPGNKNELQINEYKGMKVTETLPLWTSTDTHG